MAPYVENRVISDEWKEKFPTSDDITFQDLKEIFTADLDDGTTVFDGNVKDINIIILEIYPNLKYSEIPILNIF